MAQFLPVGKLAKAYQNLKSRTESIKEKGEETFREGKKFVEVGAAAYGFGYVNTRYGSVQKSDGSTMFLPEKEVMGVAVDLGAAALLGIGGLAGMAGKYGEDACNLGAGALASYLNRAGMTKGRDNLLKAQAGPQQVTSGAWPGASGMYGSKQPHYQNVG